MKLYYRIGEIAKLYNIGTDSLRYYEKLGILNPKRDTNDYRMYHIHDLWRLNVIRDLRELGFSMEKIKDYLDNRSLFSTKCMLEEEFTRITQKIETLEELKANIEERLENIEEAMMQPFGMIEQKKIPIRKCHIIHKGYKEDVEMDLLIKQLLNKNQETLYLIGNNRIGSMIPLDKVKSGDYSYYTDVFIIDKSGSECLAGGTYLTVCYQGGYKQTEEYIPLLLAYAEEHDLVPAGPILELLWADIHLTEEQGEHITELQILCS